jgi:hypothetical protein
VVRATFCESLPGAMLQILMEADVEGLIGAGPPRALTRSAQLPQWLRAQLCLGGSLNSPKLF